MHTSVRVASVVDAFLACAPLFDFSPKVWKIEGGCPNRE